MQDNIGLAGISQHVYPSLFTTYRPPAKTVKVSSGSFASDPGAAVLRAMSAMPAIATELMHRGELMRWAMPYSCSAQQTMRMGLAYSVTSSARATPDLALTPNPSDLCPSLSWIGSTGVTRKSMLAFGFDGRRVRF